MKSLYLFRGLSRRCLDFSSHCTSRTKGLFSLGRGDGSSDRESSVVGVGRRRITEVVSGVGNWGMGVGGGDKGGSSIGGGGGKVSCCNRSGSIGSNWSSHSNGSNRLDVDISLSWDLDINVGLSSNFLMDIRLSGDLGIYVGLSSNLLMDIRLSGDLGINIGLSLNVLMDVSLSSRVEVGISYRWVIDSSIDSSIDSRGSSIAIVGSDWGSGIGGRDWGSGIG